MITLALALLAQQGDAAFAYDAWEAWNAFGPGSMVEHEYETTAGTAKTRRTIEQKGEKLITIRSITWTKVDDRTEEQAETEQVAKPEKPGPPARPSCTKCGKAHPPEVQESREKLKVGERELECVLVEKKLKDCTGRPDGTWRGWYSRQVPGWLVKMESIVDETRLTTACVRFEKK